MTHDALAALNHLDPARAEPSDTAARRRDAMLERILAAPQTAPSPAPRSRRRTGRIIAAAAAAALLVPVAIAGTHLVARQLDPTRHGLSSADLAGWVTTTVPRSAAHLSPRAKQWCIDATDRQAGAHASIAIKGGDQRGAVASMLITRGEYTDICLADETGGGGYWEIVSSTDTPLPGVAAREVLMQSAGEHGSDDIGTAWGQAGTDIRTVSLHLGTREVEATVTDGIWNAWWPSATIADGFARTATVTYTDGRTATVPVRTP